jgi:hypothetical protein
MSTRREDLAWGCTVLSMQSDGLRIELPDFKAANVTLNGDYWWQVVTSRIGGVPTILEVLIMSWFMSLGKILLQNSVCRNLFDPVRHPVDLWKVEVGI